MGFALNYGEKATNNVIFAFGEVVAANNDQKSPAMLKFLFYVEG